MKKPLWLSVLKWAVIVAITLGLLEFAIQAIYIHKVFAR